MVKTESSRDEVEQRVNLFLCPYKPLLEGGRVNICQRGE